MSKLVKPWPYTQKDPCPTCYSWIPKDSASTHKNMFATHVVGLNVNCFGRIL